jgi:hypothetical protein
LLIGRDLCCSFALDPRGDLGAVLYETQKVVTVEVIYQPPGNFHQLVNALSIAFAIFESTKGLSREQTLMGNMESILSSVGRTLDRCCSTTVGC